MTQPGGGEDDKRRWGGRRAAAAEQSHLTHLFFLSLPFSPFLITERAR